MLSTIRQPYNSNVIAAVEFPLNELANKNARSKTLRLNESFIYKTKKDEFAQYVKSNYRDILIEYRKKTDPRYDGSFEEQDDEELVECTLLEKLWAMFEGMDLEDFEIFCEELELEDDGEEDEDEKDEDEKEEDEGLEVDNDNTKIEFNDGDIVNLDDLECLFDINEDQLVKNEVEDGDEKEEDEGLEVDNDDMKIEFNDGDIANLDDLEYLFDINEDQLVENEVEVDDEGEKEEVEGEIEAGEEIEVEEGNDSGGDEIGDGELEGSKENDEGEDKTNITTTALVQINNMDTEKVVCIVFTALLFEAYAADVKLNIGNLGCKNIDPNNNGEANKIFKYPLDNQLLPISLKFVS